MDKTSKLIYSWAIGGFATNDVISMGDGMYIIAQSTTGAVPSTKTIWICQQEAGLLNKIQLLCTTYSWTGCALAYDGNYIYASGSNTAIPMSKTILKFDLETGALIERFSTTGTRRAFQTFDDHYMYYNSAGTITQYDLEYNPIDSFVADTLGTANVCWDGQDFYTCILWGMGFYNLHKILRNGSVCPAMGLITGPLVEVDEQYVYSIV
jgi:hypothetical protein